jgi:cell division protein FtsL
MNTIKTKIGFEIKPCTIQAINWYELSHVSAKLCGQVLLLLALFLSAGNWPYLKSIQRQQTQRLQSLQQETVQLQQEYNQLVMAHDALLSPSRLQSLSSKVNMHKPTKQQTIYLPKYQVK